MSNEYIQTVMLKNLVLITRPGGDISSHSLQLFRKLKDLRLIERLDSVSKEGPCWAHNSAFMTLCDRQGHVTATIKDHSKIIDTLESTKSN